MAWLYDEDINKPTVDRLRKAGFQGKHIQYDLKYGGKEDIDVVEIARQEKSTIITANPSQYLKMSNTKFYNTGGVWILHTEDQEEQVKWMLEAKNLTKLYTQNQRNEKKVDINPTYIQVLDCRNPSKPKRYRKKL